MIYCIKLVRHVICLYRKVLIGNGMKNYKVSLYIIMLCVIAVNSLSSNLIGAPSKPATALTKKPSPTVKAPLPTVKPTVKAPVPTPASAPIVVKSAMGTAATGAGVYPEWKRKLYINAFKFIVGDAAISTADKVINGITTMAGYDAAYYTGQKKTDLTAIKAGKPTSGFTMTHYLSVLQKLGDVNAKFLNAAGAVLELGANAAKTGVVTYIGTSALPNIKITAGGVDYFVFKQ